MTRIITSIVCSLLRPLPRPLADDERVREDSTSLVGRLNKNHSPVVAREVTPVRASAARRKRTPWT